MAGIKQNNKSKYIQRFLFVFSCFFGWVCLLSADQAHALGPVNDSCGGATVITIPGNGYGLGTFTSLSSDLTSATVQPGETFAPAIFVAGLDKKSVWYRFSIPTIRAVRVTLTQPGTTITAGDAGFAVYQASGCLPTNANISSKLTPIVTFGNTYHPCVPSGDYYIQVSSKLAANGPINIELEISDQTGAAYDHPNQAYSFGTANNFVRKIDFNTECQSIEDDAETCSAFPASASYNKSAWFTFKTPSYFDYLVVSLSGTGASTYFLSNNGLATNRIFGYNLYKGNVLTSAYNTLPVVDGCDSLITNGYYAAYKMYKCADLDTGTVYTIQLFIQKDFADDVRLGIITGGQTPTRAPRPVLSAVPAPNAAGVLPASANGTQTILYDTWGCNSRHTGSNCNPSLPDSGILFSGTYYNLSSFFTFTISGAAAIYFDAYSTQCGPYPLVRVFKQGLTNSCNGLDTSNLISTFVRNNTLDCLAPGDYTVQVSGQDVTQYFGYFTYGTPTYNAEQCLSNNLGTAFRLGMNVYSRKAANKYSLITTGAFDSINVVGNTMMPLLSGVDYTASPDTIGCQPTLRPADTTCSPINDKVIYREFLVADSGVVYLNNLTPGYYTPWRYRIYSGDANALASAQNVFAYPDSVSGLIPKTECMDGTYYCYNKSVCVIPGTHTLTTMAGVGDVGRVDKPTITFAKARTKHYSPFTAQDMGSIMDTLGVNGGTIKTDVDTWSCTDNAVSINGYQPCVLGGKPATKAIYRQFFLKEPALIQISNTFYYYCYNFAYGTKTLFYGRATDGLSALSPVGTGWSCFPGTAGTTAGCNLLPAGWYTVVSYGQGSSYDSTTRSLFYNGRYNSDVGYNDEFNITVTPTCKGPQFNRPYKASVATGNQPHLIQWGNRLVSTPVYPRTDTTYALPTEYFNCTLDTPFSNHPIKSCYTGANRVAYYVFKTTQVSFITIYAGGYYCALYDKDVRSDSALFGTLRPIQSCNNSNGYVQFCNFQPGVYTLVLYAGDGNVCQSAMPSIYIDRVGYSRFDFARNAYDFGVVPPDSVYHTGKVGDVNPLNSLRPASSDFFYCTTGAVTTDPTEPVCGNTKVNPYVYNSTPNHPFFDSAYPASNGAVRRNLWYTFVVNQPGNIRVKVENKTTGHAYQPKFAVYQSNVNGNLPFATVVATGQVDSTQQQGLSFIGTNYVWYYCFNAYNELSFYRDPCSSVTNRYYLLVENVNTEPYEPGGQLPSTQVDVSILVDSVTLVLPKHDHYSLAGDIGNVGVGTFQGDLDNYSCATKDATDPIYYYGNSAGCNKTLWYKFNATITGNVRYQINVNGSLKYDYYDVQLFRQTIPGDSTSNGLKVIGYTAVYDPATNSYWAETCVSPGTYYLLLTGCAQINAYVYPRIQLIEAVGDFCSRAVPAVINGAGSVSASVLVNCHTIGTDYGEFGPQLTCPPGANTADYKSSWFRMDIGGTDTLDVTAYLVENTNAASSDIKYRLMTGDCGAMQEQSCVLDALTQNTYQCLVPGQSYYVQVFTPITKFNQAVNGTIDLKLSAVAHADTCAPLTNCLASANFNTLFNCNTDDSVKFVNFSTYGTSIAYKWSFGYNNQTSTTVSPSFFYPALATDQTYTVKLVVTNTSCGQKDSVTRTLTVPARPYVNFGNDISRCNGTPITLVASSHPGATYQWQNGSTSDTFRVTATGSADFWVKITYQGCSSTDTVKVVISPVTARAKQQVVLCGDSILLNASRPVSVTYRWNTGSTAASIYASTPGNYWVDVTYLTCTYRDSFVVGNVSTARPLGNDTTVCLARPFVLRATTAGAVSYLWQNGSTADTFRVTTAGQYRVTIQFANCTVRDTVNISGFPAPIQTSKDTTVCAGTRFILPWGTQVTVAGTYRDTIRYASGCDSLIRRVNLTYYAAPNLGRDTSVCLATTPFVLNATTTAAIGYQWQNGSTLNTFNVTAPGIYWVDVRFASCTKRDSITISGLPAPLVTTKDTSICAGSVLQLPWGIAVTAAGTYRDTLRTRQGCDSVIRIVLLTVLPKPALGRDSTVRYCPGFTVDLTGLYATTGYTSQWTFGGTPAAAPTAASTPGVYRLIATAPGGCTDTAFVTLSLQAKPVLGLDRVAAICEGQSFNLLPLYNTTNLSSSWTINAIAVANPSAVQNSGTYQLMATNASGCADTARVALTVNPKPVLGNDTSIAICSGAVYNLTTLYNTIGLSSSWALNQTPVVNPNTVSTDGVYQLLVRAATGCADTANVTLTYLPKPNLGNNQTTSICAGKTFNLSTVFNTTGLNGVWTLNGASIVTPAAVQQGGSYQLIATNVSGCSDTTLLQLTVNPKPFIGNDTAGNTCSGRPYNLTGLFNTSGLTTNWTLNNVNVSTPTSISVPGTYQLIGINAQGCSDTALAGISVYPKPYLGLDTIIRICLGRTINLTSIYPTTNLTTQWTTGNNPVANPTSITQAALYQLIATNVQGCSDTALVNITVLPKPQLGNDLTISRCAGLPIDLTALMNPAGNVNNWILNNANVSTPTAITVSGSYQLISTNPVGCSDTALVLVNILPKPFIGVDATDTICSGLVRNLNGYFNMAGLTSQWTLQSNLVVNPQAVTLAGLYQVIATNPQACSDTALVNIVHLPKPQLGNDLQLSHCQNDPFNLVTLFPGGNGNSNSWTVNQSPVANPTAILLSGTYQLISTNPQGCSDTVLAILSFTPNPFVQINAPANICPTQTTDLTLPAVTNGSDGGLTFAYYNDSTAISIYPTPTQAPAGTYYVQGTNANGCKTMAQVQVQLHQPPRVGAGSPQLICDGDSAFVQATVSQTTVPVTYAWTTVSAGTISQPTAAGTWVQPVASQSYIVTITDGYGCGYQVSDTVLIRVQPPVRAFAGYDTIAVAGAPHQLLASGGVSYTWTPTSFLNNPNIANPKATLTVDSIRYYVMVKDVAGCTGYASVFVRVLQGITYYVPNAFTPNGDGSNDVFRPIPVGIVSTEFFQVFNRYGELVFATSQHGKGWDGTYKGIAQPIGNYVWILKGKGSNGKTIEQKGNVVLIR